MRIVGFVLTLSALYLATHDALEAMYSTEGVLLVLLGTLCLVRFTGFRFAAWFRRVAAVGIPRRTSGPALPGGGWLASAPWAWACSEPRSELL
jgi:hypothetical protein